MARSGRYINQLRGYKAFIPTPLPPEPGLSINNDFLKNQEQATLSLARLDGLTYGLLNIDLFIAMYVKKEALLSAQIEGTQASLENIFEYEQGVAVENVNDVKDVVNYIKALDYGIKRLQTLPMSVRLIKELHAILLDDTRGSHKTPGEFKRTQNWIGPSGGTLKNAVFVPPPPEEAAEAMSDLEKYMHSDTHYSELINCALMHYQFETIHPFLDGNGRLGRLLITLYLYWKGVIEKPILYSSYYFKLHRQEYYDRLMMVRNNGNYEQWVDFFLKAVSEASNSAINDTKKILALQSKHQALLWERKISSSVAVLLLQQLFYTPVITIKDVEKRFSITYPTAAHLINQFVAAGILQEVTGQKRAKRFVYREYMDILSEGTVPLAAP
jgi:Fic family protein